MYYLLFYEVVSNYVEKRAPYRKQHLKLATEAVERGELLLGGATADPINGAVLLFKSDSPEAVMSFARQDPYVKNHCVSSWKVREWTVVTGVLAE